MVKTRRARGAVTDAGARPSLARDAHTLSPLVAAFLDTRSVADFIGALGKKLARTDAIWHAHAPVLVAYADRLFLAANAERARLGYDSDEDVAQQGGWLTSTWQKMAWQSLCKRASVARMQMEYLAWKLFPIPGFKVELMFPNAMEPNADVPGSINVWKVVVPGPQGSFLHHTEYDTRWAFRAFPFRPPKIQFHPKIFHPNVYPSGTVSSALLNEEECFDPRFRCRDLMLNLQHLLLHGCHNDICQLNIQQFLWDGSGGSPSPDKRLAYAKQLRDSGRAVFRSNESFGHRAVPHILFDHDDDFISRRDRPWLGRVGDLDPARPLSHAVYPAILDDEWLQTRLVD